MTSPAPRDTEPVPVLVLALVAARERLADAVLSAVRPHGITEWDAIDAAACDLAAARVRFDAAAGKAREHVNFPASPGPADTGPTWTLTRAQLIDAFENIEVHPVLLSKRATGVVLAEDMADAILRQLTPDEVVHACPVAEGGLMPCCGQTPFEVPGTERMTLEPGLVTCRSAADGDTPSLAAALKASPAATEPTTACRTDRHQLCYGYRCTCDCHAAVSSPAPGDSR